MSAQGLLERPRSARDSGVQGKHSECQDTGVLGCNGTHIARYPRQPTLPTTSTEQPFALTSRSALGCQLTWATVAVGREAQNAVAQILCADGITSQCMCQVKSCCQGEHCGSVFQPPPIFETIQESRSRRNNNGAYPMRFGPAQAHGSSERGHAGSSCQNLPSFSYLIQIDVQMRPGLLHLSPVAALSQRAPSCCYAMVKVARDEILKWFDCLDVMPAFASTLDSGHVRDRRSTAKGWPVGTCACLASASVFWFPPIDCAMWNKLLPNAHTQCSHFPHHCSYLRDSWCGLNCRFVFMAPLHPARISELHAKPSTQEWYWSMLYSDIQGSKAKVAGFRLWSTRLVHPQGHLWCNCPFVTGQSSEIHLVAAKTLEEVPAITTDYWNAQDCPSSGYISLVPVKKQASETSSHSQGHSNKVRNLFNSANTTVEKPSFDPLGLQSCSHPIPKHRLFGSANKNQVLS